MSETNSDLSGILQKVLADPEALQKIMRLAGEMKGGGTGGTGGESTEHAEGGAAGEGAGGAPQSGAAQGEGTGKPSKREAAEEEENRIKLLSALMPYLNEDRREKADVMIRILKLLRFTDLNELTKLLGGIAK